MKVAVVGSRKYADLERVRAFVRSLPEGTTVISGGAVGVDHAAAEAARERGMSVIEWLPLWELYGRAAGPIRNKAIAAGCDEMHAFWDGHSRGTANAVDEARALGKEVTVHMCAHPSGAGDDSKDGGADA